MYHSTNQQPHDIEALDREKEGVKFSQTPKSLCIIRIFFFHGVAYRGVIHSNCVLLIGEVLFQKNHLLILHKQD